MVPYSPTDLSLFYTGAENVLLLLPWFHLHEILDKLSSTNPLIKLISIRFKLKELKRSYTSYNWSFPPVTQNKKAAWKTTSLCIVYSFSFSFSFLIQMQPVPARCHSKPHSSTAEGRSKLWLFFPIFTIYSLLTFKELSMGKSSLPAHKYRLEKLI